MINTGAANWGWLMVHLVTAVSMQTVPPLGFGTGQSASSTP